MPRRPKVHAERLAFGAIGRRNRYLLIELVTPSEAFDALISLTPADAANLAARLIAWSTANSKSRGTPIRGAQC